MLKWFRRKKDGDGEAVEGVGTGDGAVEDGVVDAVEGGAVAEDTPVEGVTVDEVGSGFAELKIKNEELGDAESLGGDEVAGEDEVGAEGEGGFAELEMKNEKLGEGESAEGGGEVLADGGEEEAGGKGEAEGEAGVEAESAGKGRGFFGRLRERLGKTRGALVEGVRAAVGLGGKLDEDVLEEIEDVLIQCDVGVRTTQGITERLRREAKKAGGELGGERVLELFKEAMGEILGGEQRGLDFGLERPMVVMMVGVNGTGKTTTIGKLGKMLAGEGKRVMMVAADTFRAGAADQLQVWAERTGSCIVRREEGADPASVIYEALEGAKRDEPDVVLIDTAGRLHTKVGLMEELKKLRRVVKKHYPEAPHETVLVLDATTGQNALNQLKVFHEAVELTGLIMTKLDGTAKGGVLIACKDASHLPIFKIGIGEGAEDLRDFDAGEFVEALFAGGKDEEGGDA